MTFDPFSHPGPRWFSIAAHRPFLGDLAAGLLDWLGTEPPETLSDAVVLLPNRRAARALAQALAEASGDRPVLMPQVRPLGDLEEDEPPFAPGDIEADLAPAIAPLRRRFELARLIAARHPTPLDALAALEMAEALGAFLDSCQIEEIRDPGRVGDLVEADLAEHWRASAALLAVALEAWPERLEALGLMDPAARRVRLLDRLAQAWTARPPAHPVIAAGSTGTVPAAARVLGAVALAPRGCVVLPGLDLDMTLSDADWAEVDHQHPQGAMKALLDRRGIDRRQVRPWPARETPAEARAGRARRRLLAEALKPPRATADWRRVIEAMSAEADNPLAQGLQGLSLTVGRAEEDSAARIAVLMRQGLETPGGVIALVTPDQDLARRVQARLARWGLAADASTGAPLARTPAGALVQGLLALMSHGLTATALLAVLKHPLARAGAAGTEADALDDLERLALRGPSPGDWAALAARLTQARAPRRDGRPASAATLAASARAQALLDRLPGLFDPILAPDPRDASTHARALTEAIEALAGGDDRAWRGPDGEAMARLLTEVIAEGEASGPLTPRVFAEIVSRLIGAEVVRSGGDTHPRLRILGAIEARLARADRVILAGLEEGVWPAGAGLDPFLSRPMRAAIDLPSPERRIGLSAHDFAQAAAGPEVILVHTERRGGQPAVRSRWLWRLETLLKGAGLGLDEPSGLEGWAAGLDRAPPDVPDSLSPAQRPRPRPAVEARPLAMSVTRVEEWVRDPYATYARLILKLTQMARPDERVDARVRGTAIHAAIERFAQDWEVRGAAEGPARFAAHYLEALAAQGMPATALARERPLAEGAGRFVTALEAERRADGRHVFVERYAELVLPMPRGDFVLRAQADRLELIDGRLSVLDFKTGAPPSVKQVRLGFAAQLPLTAAMAARGAFADLGRPTPDELIYVAVTGRETQGPPREVSGDEGAAALSERAFAGLVERLARFEDPGVAYPSRSAPQFAQKAVSDYDHLARVREWSTAQEDGE